MGKTRMFTYRLEIRCVSRNIYTPMEWRVKGSRLSGPGYGKATIENLDKWVTAFEESMVSGPNKHLGIDQVVSAWVVDQRTGEVVAEWRRSEQRKDQPFFQLIS